MNNDIHLIWQPLPGHSLTSIQLSFMKFTAQQIKFALIKDNSPILEKCRVNKKDRTFQIWKRNPLSVELSLQKVFLQKMEYIHYNPVEAGLTLCPEAYHYSSAAFYETGVDHFNMLTHYMGWIKGNTLMVDVVGEKHQQRRLMVVTLFISTLVKAVCKLRLPNSNSGESYRSARFWRSITVFQMSETWLLYFEIL